MNTSDIPVLVVEDEPVLAQRLQQQLKACWRGIDLLPLADNGAAAIALAREHLPRAIFLDIHMPACSGLDAAEAILEDWPEGTPLPFLVFVTAYGQYAAQAFECEAVDYLLKPVAIERLRKTVERLQRRLAQPAAPAVDASLGDELQRLAASMRPAAAPLEVVNAAVGHVTWLIPIEDVLYFEAAEKYLRVVTRQREALIRMTLRELLARLPADRFWQVHRSVVVQGRHVSHVERSEAGRLFLALHGHADRLAVSRLFAHRFKAM